MNGNSNRARKKPATSFAVYLATHKGEEAQANRLEKRLKQANERNDFDYFFSALCEEPKIYPSTVTHLMGAVQKQMALNWLDIERRGRTNRAKDGAGARHAEDHAMKRKVYEWLDAHPPKPRGKNAAARTIDRANIALVTTGTIRRWIDDWEDHVPV